MKELLLETLPARIETDEEYDRILARFGDLFNRKLTRAEERLRDLPGVLIREYDQRDPRLLDNCYRRSSAK